VIEYPLGMDDSPFKDIHNSCTYQTAVLYVLYIAIAVQKWYPTMETRFMCKQNRGAVYCSRTDVSCKSVDTVKFD